MKKRICLVLILLVIGIAFAFNKNIDTFADSPLEIDYFQEGYIYKTGDIVTLNEACLYYGYYRSIFGVTAYDKDDMDGDNVGSPVAGTNNNKFTFPEKDGKNVFWKVVKSRTKDDYYCYQNIIIESFTREDPKLTVVCEKNTLKPNEETTCKIKFKYYDPMEKVSFDLNTLNLSVSDVVINSNWTKKSETGLYELEVNEIDNTINKDNPKEEELLTFKIKGITDEVDLTANLNVANITYKDDLREGSLEEQEAEVTIEAVPTTTTTTTTQVEKEEENPKTGIKEYGYILLSVIFVAATLYFVLRKRDYLKMNK